MMNTLDPHSAYLDSEVFSKMQEETSGEFGGLGIEVTQKDGVLVIVTPIEDSPAFKAVSKQVIKLLKSTMSRWWDQLFNRPLISFVGK